MFNVSIEKTVWTQSRLHQLDQTDVDLDASKHSSRRRKQTFSMSMYFRLLQNRNIVLGCEIFKDFFLDIHDIY